MRKYPKMSNGKLIKIAHCWYDMTRRCQHEGIYDPNIDAANSYNNVSMSEEFSDYDLFYEWAISQENYEIWTKTPRAAIDKDIKEYGNKIYCSEKCLLVPQSINCAFVNLLGSSKKPETKGLPNVQYEDRATRVNHFRAQSNFHGRNISGPFRHTPEEAYEDARDLKKQCIIKLAQEEYDKGTISSECYDILMAFEMPTLEEIKRNLETDFDYER